MSIKHRIKSLIPDRILSMLQIGIRRFNEYLMIESIKRAVKEQGLLPLNNELCQIVPDISDQYAAFIIDTEYLNVNVRAVHAFQMSLVSRAIKYVENKKVNGEKVIIVDIGDSAGTHIRYIKDMFKDRDIRCLSVDIDPKAVEKIKSKGLDAICARAEALPSLGVDADMYLSFEMFEHLMNPCQFLHDLSEKTNCKAFVITVPYTAHSRVGLGHIRNGIEKKVNPESAHIFELSPSDWGLLFKHSGWKILYENIYFQYPKKSIFRSLLKNIWRKRDFEGFYGAILTRDTTWSKLYDGWQ